MNKTNTMFFFRDSARARLHASSLIMRTRSCAFRCLSFSACDTRFFLRACCFRVFGARACSFGDFFSVVPFFFPLRDFTISIPKNDMA